MTTIILSIVCAVLLLTSLFFAFLFFVTGNRYEEHYRVMEDELERKEKADLETIDGLRGLLHLLDEFKLTAIKITKKYDLINHPDFVQFQTQLVSLSDIIEIILRNDGGDIHAEDNVKEERR